MCKCTLSHFSRVQLCATLWTVARQAPLFMGFSRQENWSGLSCPPPGGLLDPGINLCLFCLLHWQAGSLPLVPPGKPRLHEYKCLIGPHPQFIEGDFQESIKLRETWYLCVKLNWSHHDARDSVSLCMQAGLCWRM